MSDSPDLHRFQAIAQELIYLHRAVFEHIWRPSVDPAVPHWADVLYLRDLYMNGPGTVSDLARRFLVTRQAMSRIVTRLAEAGLVVKSKGIVLLTPAGESLTIDQMAHGRRLAELSEERMTPEQIAATNHGVDVLRELRRILESLDWDDLHRRARPPTDEPKRD